MPRIKIDQLKQGMVIAADVNNMDGMLLLPAGCALSERQIDVLHAWGVAEVSVEATDGVDPSADPLAKLTPDAAARLTADVKALFWELDETNPAHQEVFKLVLRRRAKKECPG